MTATRFTPHTLPQADLKPSITIVVSPREHFGYTQQSLDSIYKHTKVPFELVYVDAGSPKHVQEHLVQAAIKYNFTLLRSDHFLAPNQARNLGLSQVTTDYVVFIANDIHVSPGWLDCLWQCAQETDAAVVCPLIRVRKSLHEPGASDKAKIFTDIQDDKRFLIDCSATAIKQQLSREACELAELNCLLVKRDIFEQVGYLDPRLLGTQADMDFCLSINQVGGSIFCETTSVVTHVSQRPGHWSDWAYFMLRWSDAWERESLMCFQQKWNLDISRDSQQRYSQLGQHRHQAYPLLRQLTRGNITPWLEQLAINLEKWFNQVLTDRHARSSYDAIGKVVHTSVASTQKMESQTNAVTAVASVSS